MESLILLESYIHIQRKSRENRRGSTASAHIALRPIYKLIAYLDVVPMTVEMVTDPVAMFPVVRHMLNQVRQ
jgi:hypothetical protein